MEHDFYPHAVMLASMVFVPAVIFWFLALTVWTANKRPEMSGWRAATFKSGLISAAVAMVLLAPGGAYILTDQTETPLPRIWGVVNVLGVLLWVASFGTAFAGRGAGRVLLLISDTFALLAFLIIATFVP